jgi:MFS family permease
MKETRRFKVSGIDRQTGLECVEYVAADSERDAVLHAGKTILVEHIEKDRDSPESDAPAVADPSIVASADVAQSSDSTTPKPASTGGRSFWQLKVAAGVSAIFPVFIVVLALFVAETRVDFLIILGLGGFFVLPIAVLLWARRLCLKSYKSATKEPSLSDSQQVSGHQPIQLGRSLWQLRVAAVFFFILCLIELLGLLTNDATVSEWIASVILAALWCTSGFLLLWARKVCLKTDPPGTIYKPTYHLLGAMGLAVTIIGVFFFFGTNVQRNHDETYNRLITDQYALDGRAVPRSELRDTDYSTSYIVCLIITVFGFVLLMWRHTLLSNWNNAFMLQQRQQPV